MLNVLANCIAVETVLVPKPSIAIPSSLKIFPLIAAFVDVPPIDVDQDPDADNQVKDGKKQIDGLRKRCKNTI